MSRHKKTKRKKIFFITLIVLVLGFIAFILNESKDEINANFTNIEEILEKAEKNNRLAGFAVSVFTKDTVLFKKGFGFSDVKNKLPYTTMTKQYIASISKTTIGVSLLKSQELGLLNIDDPINKYLPFKIENPNFRNDQITLKQLATHTSSLDYNEKVVESLYISEALKEKSLKGFTEAYFRDKRYGPVTFMKNKPGTVFNYSNIGAGLAAYIIELTSGMTFDDFTEKYIFAPLDLDDTTWFAQPTDSLILSKHYEFQDSILTISPSNGVILYPARDLITTVNDLTRYCQAIMANSATLLSANSYDMLLGPQLDSNVEIEAVDNSGLFWMIDRNQYGIVYQLTGMNGGDKNINTMMQFNPKTGLGYIFIGNTGQSPKNRFNHIWVYNALVSLGDYYLMNDPKHTFVDKVGFKWHNIYSRFAGLF